MLRGRTATVATVCAIAAAAAVTAGCGGGSSSSALRLDPVAAAATKTQNAGAAHVRLRMVLKGHGRTVRLHGTGTIDGTSSEMSFNLGSMLSQMGLPSAGTPGAASLKEVALEQNGDYVIYLHLGFLSSQLPGGKQWVKVDLTKLGKSAGIDLGKILSGSQVQPTDLLSMLKADGATVHKIGPATVDGVATTHYRVTVDMAKTLQSKGLASPLLSAAAAQVKTIRENVWIGQDGLVRRITVRYSSARADAARMAMRMDISDYGAHATITAPPSSQVFDATQFAQQGLASSLH
ncbi:MAG TPA: hypothetical protein VIC70_00310 [Gaiellaceae bacterium]|jgi:hypothetical protein